MRAVRRARRGRGGRPGAVTSGPVLVAAGLLAAATVVLAPGSADAAGTSGKRIAMWHMNETSGTKVRDSASAGGRSTGTRHHVRAGRTGKRGKAYRFNGRSSHVSVPSSGALNPGSADITVRISLRTTKLPSKRGDWDLIRKGYFDTAGGEYKIELQHTGRVSCGFEGTRRHLEIEAGPRNLANGRWHTVSCTKTGTRIRLTVDGRRFSRAGRVGSISNRKPVVIGAHAGPGIAAGSRPGGQWYRGLLDEASITVG